MAQPVQPTSLDRLLTSLRLIIRAELPQLTFFGTYEYSIQNASDSTVDVAPVDTTISLPSIKGVPLVSSLLGQAVQANEGLCRIRFVNGDPTKPVCVGLRSLPSSSSTDATGTINVGPSASMVILNNGTLGVARLGDPITLYIPPGCYVTGMITPASGPPIPITKISIVNGLGAMIGSASPNVVTE